MKERTGRPHKALDRWMLWAGVAIVVVFTAVAGAYLWRDGGSRAHGQGSQGGPATNTAAGP